MIHFKCTSLPAYQLHHFVNTKGYRRYECSSCSGVIPQHILEESVSLEQTPRDNEEYRERIKASEDENKLKTDENIKLRDDDNYLKRQLEIVEKRNEILRSDMYDKEVLIRIRHGNEVPATQSINTNSKENITTEEANGMKMKENNAICSFSPGSATMSRRNSKRHMVSLYNHGKGPM